MLGDEEPRTLGRYELVRKIGRGGMAEVWLAQSSAMAGSAKPCALKVMLPQLADDPRYRRMFLAEARLCMQLTHTNIVQVFDAGQHGDALYLAMEWVDGTDLATLAARVARDGGELPVAVVAYVVGELLHALDYAHRLTSDGRPLGLVHRDVSPQNVLISAAGEVKLTDFGVASILPEESSHEYAKGKLRYMPREQLMGRACTASDLYSVGAVLHELLDGRKFRHGIGEQELYAEILEGDPPPLLRSDIAPELERLRSALLVPDAASRLQSAAQALLILERWGGYRAGRTRLRRLYEVTFGAEAPRTGLRRIQAGSAAVVPTRMIDNRIDPDASTHTHHPDEASSDAGDALPVTVPRVADRGAGRSSSTTTGPPKRRRSAAGAGLATLAMLGVMVAALGLVASGPSRGASGHVADDTTAMSVTIDVDRRDVDRAWVRIGDVELTVGTGVRVRLPPGAYELRWRTSPDDAWHRAGSYRLTSGRYHVAITPKGPHVRHG